MLYITFCLIFTIPAIMGQKHPHFTAEDLKVVDIPCQCLYPECNCCLKFNLPVAETTERKKACAKLMYDPQDIGFKLSIVLGDKTLYEGEISTANPPPACVSLPMAPFIAFCAKAYNVRIKKDSAQACLKLSIRLFGKDVTTIDLQCTKITGNIVMSSLQPDLQVF